MNTQLYAARVLLALLTLYSLVGRAFGASAPALVPPPTPALTSSDTFQNPILPQGADPWVLWAEGEYFYIRSQQNTLVLSRTPDVTALATAPKKVIWTPKDPSNARHLWAPEIHRLNGKWYVYYSADDGNTENHQLYVLENASADPFGGEFVMKGRISTDPDNNWAIDGTVFEHAGSSYLLWSGWQTRRVDTEIQCIYIARMLNPWTLATPRILISKPDYEWERHHLNKDGSHPKHVVYVNEGPQPLLSPDGRILHVVYSASGFWTPHYALGLLSARADADLLDPKSWTKLKTPVFRQSPENGVYGPGHNCFFKSPDGKQDYIFYHARDKESDARGTRDTRSPRIQPFTWNSEGYPVFGEPLPLTTRLKKPPVESRE